MRGLFKTFIIILSCVFIHPTYSQDIARNVHAFYYPWYGNPQTDGHWMHWDHSIIVEPHKSEGNYNPPDNIGANYYPELGCYSSMDKTTVENHMQQLTKAGVGVISTSWWGVNTDTDKAVPLILKVAEQYNIQVNFHIEPFPSRNAVTTKEKIKYIIDTYGESKAFYRDPQNNKPMFYVYDSYLTPAEEWNEILSPKGRHSIRGTKYDSIVIGLYVKQHDHEFMDTGNFDGFYTYFATNEFTYGSTIKNWQKLADYAKQSGKMFIPSVGPGYIDTRIRPWNDKNTRGREEGKYYNRMWQAALDVKPKIVSITSFNEWHEGTQIETTIPKSIEGYTYLDFSPLPPDGYLTLTKQWVEKFVQ